jgi:hypothetical protein
MPRKIIISVLLAVFALVVLGAIYAESYFQSYAPRHPDPARGLVYPVSVQQAQPVYLSRRQWFWFESPAIHLAGSSICVLCLGGAALLIQRERRKDLTMRSS